MNKKTRIAIVTLGVLFLVFFYVFSRQVKRGFLKQTDFNVTVRLQNHIPKRLDEMWEDLAFFVTPTSSIFIVGLLTVAALVDFKKKKIRFRAVIIPLLFGALVMGELYGKSIVHHPAPPFFMIKNPTTIFPQFYINEQYSYPSGHTARAVFLGLVFYSLFKSKKLKLLAALGVFTYIFMVAFGRIYLGHHWLSDVIGGALLGSGLGLLTMNVISPIIDKQ